MTVSRIFSTAAWIARAMEYLIKVYQASEALGAAYNTYKDPKLSSGKKTQRIAINCFFAIAQGTEIAAHLSNSSMAWQMGTKFVAGTGEAFCALDSGKSIKDVVQYRLLDIAGCYTTHHQLPTAKSALDMMESAYMIYSDRQKFSAAICSLKNRVIFHQGQFFLFQVRPIPNQPLPAPSATIPAAAAGAPPIPVAPSEGMQVEAKPVKKRKNLGQEAEDMLRTRDIEEWKDIPEMLTSDPVLQLYCCSITHKPIRFLLVVTATKEWESPVYYERKTIEDWLKEHPQQLPENWPEGVPLQMASLSVCRDKQAQIDKQLQQVLANARESAELLRRSGRGEQ